MSRHQHRTVVKRVHPHAWRWRLLALLATLSVCVAAGVWWGMQLALVSPPAEDQQAALKDQIAQLLLQAEADKQTVNELRNDLADQAAEFAALEDMLAFYRGVLAPEESDALAVLRPPILLATADDRVWQMRFVVHRGAEGGAVYQGKLSRQITGQGVGVPEVRQFDEVDSESASGVFPLRFRYLQQVQVVISLPEAFVPETIESVVTLVEPARQTVRRSDVWGDLEISSPAH